MAEMKLTGRCLDIGSAQSAPGRSWDGPNTQGHAHDLADEADDVHPVSPMCSVTFNFAIQDLLAARTQSFMPEHLFLPGANIESAVRRYLCA